MAVRINLPLYYDLQKKMQIIQRMNRFRLPYHGTIYIHNYNIIISLTLVTSGNEQTRIWFIFIL